MRPNTSESLRRRWASYSEDERRAIRQKQSQTMRSRSLRTDPVKLELEWSESVRKRDDNICRICGQRVEGKMCVAHHIKSKTEYPELRYDVNNGITLCKSCHQKLHVGCRMLKSLKSTILPTLVKSLVGSIISVDKEETGSCR